MKIKAIIHPAEEGGYWAEVPALPGCITEGDTWDELLVNLKDAIEGWLEVANNSQSIESSFASEITVAGSFSREPKLAFLLVGAAWSPESFCY